MSATGVIILSYALGAVAALMCLLEANCRYVDVIIIALLVAIAIQHGAMVVRMEKE